MEVEVEIEILQFQESVNWKACRHNGVCLAITSANRLLDITASLCMENENFVGILVHYFVLI